MIELRSVGKRFRIGPGPGRKARVVEAVRDLTLAVEPGIVTGVVGPNGAGKTSLLNCITGAYRPTHGRIVYEGAADKLRSHHDVQEFYLGSGDASRASYRDVKQYRRSRRWWG